MVLQDAASSISVNIRLCGGIPRSDMNCQGAPWQGLAKAGSHDNALNANALAVTIRSKNDGAAPAMATEESKISSYIPNKANNMGILTERQPFTPLFEPPAWAVPAVGLTRLEVRYPASDADKLLTFGPFLTYFFRTADWRELYPSNSSRLDYKGDVPSWTIAGL